MKNLFGEYNLILSEKQQNLFEKYYDLLIFYNNKFNITAITEKNEVIKKHFIDSAIGVDKLVNKKVIDIGAGGGFPSIPLKIMNDNLHMTLLEATGKKCEFLREVVKELELSNVTVINDRAEILAKNPDYREKFDICVARAVARFNTLLEYSLPFVKVGGKFIAYKGDAEEEIAESKNALKLLGGKITDIDNYTLDDAKRTLITTEKIYSTPVKYPRGNGKERKRPL